MLIHLLLFYSVLITNAVQALRKTEGQKVLLSTVQSLTLRHDLKTSHRRVAAVPQLKCIGGNAKDYYNVDIMRCKNQGADYDREDIQWTCSASLPSEFKLGSTDVICEGYESSNDPYVLKGSCGVEYRLMLTAVGEERYGRKAKSKSYNTEATGPAGNGLASEPQQALPEATLLATEETRDNRRVPEDGALELRTMEKAAHLEVPDPRAHRLDQQDTRALALGPRVGDNAASLKKLQIINQSAVQYLKVGGTQPSWNAI
ncbi:MAG: hypothetical protein Q9169_003251 [Polycauliona sp. 2 TL-2023]